MTVHISYFINIVLSAIILIIIWIMIRHNYDAILCTVYRYLRELGGTWFISESAMRKHICAVVERSPCVIVELKDPKLLDMCMEFVTPTLRQTLLETVLESDCAPMLWSLASGRWQQELNGKHIKNLDVAVYLIRAGIGITAPIDLLTSRPVVNDILNYNKKTFLDVMNATKGLPSDLFLENVGGFLPCAFQVLGSG